VELGWADDIGHPVQVHWHGSRNFQGAEGAFIVISVISPWKTRFQMRRKIGDDFGRKATGAALPLNETWMKQVRERNGIAVKATLKRRPSESFAHRKSRIAVTRLLGNWQWVSQKAVQSRTGHGWHAKPGLLEFGIFMQQRTLKQRQIVLLLEHLVTKLKMQSPDFHDLDINILPDYTAARAYIIDISKGRFARRVIVDLRTVEQSGRLDSNMSQELRNAMRTVTNWAKSRK
jgi:hypothetical protein